MNRYMKKIIKSIGIQCFILLSFVILASGCGNTQDTGQGNTGDSHKLQVVATTTMRSDLVKQIGGDQVEVHGLMKAGVDPHLYQATAGDVEVMNKADIVVYNGIHLEGKMGAIFDNLEKQKKSIIRVGDAIDPATLLDFEEDGTTVKDPHIWFSVANWKLAAEAVAKGLSKKDPAHAAQYEANAKKYIAQ